jgi:hypothetical protein
MNADQHDPDWSDWQDGDDGPSCACGFNGTVNDCEASRNHDDFEAWALPQLPKFSGPARYVTAYLLLKNVWDKDPEVRHIFREGRAQMALARAAFDDLRAYEDELGIPYE